jgi:hypothetical protein
MTVRIYAALTIAFAFSLAACSTNPGVPEAASSGSQSGLKLAVGKGDGEGSASRSDDVTGSISPKESPKVRATGGPEINAPTLRAGNQKPEQQSGAGGARLPGPAKTATRKLDEPLYRPLESQMPQPQRPSSERSGTPTQSKSTDSVSVSALASEGAARTRQVAVGSAQPAWNSSGPIDLSYASEAVDLSEKDRRSVIGFAARRGSKDPITVVTGPSVGGNPLEGLLRSQERGRRLGDLLAAYGPVEIRFEPDLPRDSARID